MSKTIEAVYEKGVFRPLEPVMLLEGECVQVSVPSAEVQHCLAVLDEFEVAFEGPTEE